MTLITPNQRLIAYDAGRSEDLSPLTELERAGWKQLDYFFLSHPHADHLRDIDALIRMSPRTVRRPRPPERQIREAANGALEEGVVDRYEREIDQTYVQPSTQDPTDPSWSGGCDFAIFQPPEHANLNNVSLVVFVGFNGVYLALTGRP